MTGIARFAMQGPRQAVLLAVLFAAIPLLYWISAAVVALVILRQGLSKGINVLLPALLPGIAWYAAQQEFTVCLVILGTAMMAAILRATTSLSYAITASIVVGVLTVFLLKELSPVWIDVLKLGAEEYAIKLQETAPQVATTFGPWIYPMLLGGIAAMLQMFVIGALLLARNWQSKLFNPGGFSSEFQSLTLPVWYLLVVGLVLAVGGSSPEQVSWVSIVLVPLFIVGISIVHSVVASKQLSSQWLMGFYISLLFFLPYMYALLILMALLDMLFNIRKRLKDTA
jgi:hypothetical protein